MAPFSLIQSKKKVAKLKTADFALFASSWWPHAEFQELRILTFLAMWLFLWDDELDEPTGQYTDNFEAAQMYREETVHFIECCLGLGSEKKAPVSSHPMIESFRVIGDQLRVAYTIGK
jgi:hypothetical protein